MRHVGVGGTASAFERMGRHRFIRTQAAQAAPNFRLVILYMTIVHDCAVLVSQQPVEILPLLSHGFADGSWLDFHR
jgi:hypothetical protein